MGELNTVYLLLGSNMGDRLNYLSQARDVIKSSLGNIVSESSIYETEPWHTKDQDTYLNQAIEVLSELTGA
jgi:2-amino-4-hydroxy-6-hydroxymethyldihydropteridine diphosphokinase